MNEIFILLNGGFVKMDAKKKLEEMVNDIDEKLPHLTVGRDSQLILELMKLKYNILLNLKK